MEILVLGRNDPVQRRGDCRYGRLRQRLKVVCEGPIPCDGCMPGCRALTRASPHVVRGTPLAGGLRFTYCIGEVLSQGHFSSILILA